MAPGPILTARVEVVERGQAAAIDALHLEVSGRSTRDGGGSWVRVMNERLACAIARMLLRFTVRSELHRTIWEGGPEERSRGE